MEDTTPSFSSGQQWRESSPPGSFEFTSMRIWPGLQQNYKPAALLPQNTKETRWPTGYTAKFTGATPGASLPGTAGTLYT